MHPALGKINRNFIKNLAPWVSGGGASILNSVPMFVCEKLWGSLVEIMRTFLKLPEGAYGLFHMKSTNVMEKFKRVHDSIKPPVWSAAELPNLSESSLVRWDAVSGFARAQPSTVQSRYVRPHSPPANLDSDKFGNSAKTDQTCWIDGIMKCYGGSSSSFNIMMILLNDY